MEKKMKTKKEIEKLAEVVMNEVYGFLESVAQDEGEFVHLSKKEKGHLIGVSKNELKYLMGGMMCGILGTDKSWHGSSFEVAKIVTEELLGRAIKK